LADDDGNVESYLEARCYDKAAKTERSAILRAELDSFQAGLDDIGRQIVAMLAQGKTEREIGKACGISGVAVHKRIVKMREALKDLRAA
jgi:DNA-directed RNA polymerase specialized sigma subunit